MFLELGDDVLLGLVRGEELLGLGKLAGSRQERERLLLEGGVGQDRPKLDAFLSATLELVLEMLELIWKKINTFEGSGKEKSFT